MSVKHLSSFFSPHSIALIGASPRPGSVGAMVLKNLLAAEPDGPVWPVNPRYDHIGPYPCYRDVASLPLVPELGVIAVPAPAVPGVIAELGEKGTRAALVITAGFHKDEGDYGDELMATARTVLPRPPLSVGKIAKNRMQICHRILCR